METFVKRDSELCKIQDSTTQSMARVYLRAKFLAEDLGGKRAKEYLKGALPPAPGILGTYFEEHARRCLIFFEKDKVFKERCRQLVNEDGLLVEYRLALLLPLRQSVGSCFATAFLIHLQTTNLPLLAEELFVARKKNALKRTFDGEEMIIPFCPKTGELKGSGVFIHSALMKSFEYTVASLADVKVGFSRFNFAEALGLSKDHEGGLGKIIYSLVEEELTAANNERDELLREIEGLEKQLDYDQASFASASTLDRMDSIKRMAKYKNIALAQMVDEYEKKGEEGAFLAKLYAFFVEQYLALYPHYFQELYDPEMMGVGNILEDRPSGFRLVYKHGRSNPKLWSYIYSDKEYISYLRDFIVMTEPILTDLQRAHGMEEKVEALVSVLLQRVEEPAFLEEQKQRIAAMHKEHLGEEASISPYAYLSGGSLPALVDAFWQKEGSLEKVSISANSPTDLCLSLIEFMKDKHQGEVAHEFTPILMSNDTHACNFLPGAKLFRAAWEDRGNSYTYLRDVLLHSREPIIFADSNWGGRYFAFYPKDQQFSLVLYDGENISPFSLWNDHFGEGKTWDLYL